MSTPNDNIDRLIEDWGNQFRPATSSRGQGGLPLHGSVTDWELTLTKEGWNYHKSELKSAIRRLLLEAKKDERELAKQDVIKQHPIFLTKENVHPFNGDPMAEKAIRIREQLRKEISSDFDIRTANLESQLKEASK